MSDRKIIHVDMDAFYASVEQRDDPSLRGKPLVVGGSPDSRGVVCAASYEARKFGIRSAMPCSKAKRLCPSAIFMRGDFRKYREVSRAIDGIFRSWTDLVEPLALDEAYLDVTENKQQQPIATEIAKSIRTDIKKSLNLTASAGVAPTKMVAKIASDMNKPDGLCVVPPSKVRQFLDPLPIRRVPGIGPVTEEKCHIKGLKTIGDLARAEMGILAALFGERGEGMRSMARGEDRRRVRPPGKRKQVSVERTFERDIVDPDELLGKMHRVCAHLVPRLEKDGRQPAGLTLKVKYADFTLKTRSLAVDPPIGDLETWLWDKAQEMMAACEPGRPIRLLGLGVHRFQTDPEEETADPQQTIPGLAL